jgi:hypothetical protein
MSLPPEPSDHIIIKTPLTIMISELCGQAFITLYTLKYLLRGLLRQRIPPGRTGRLPTRSPHRPGRAQLRHPVPLVKVSLNIECSPANAICCRFVYMLPGFLSIQHISLQQFFSQVQPFPGNYSSRVIGQGSFGLGSPVSGTMTALRLLTVYPSGLLSIPPVL